MAAARRPRRQAPCSISATTASGPGGAAISAETGGVVRVHHITEMQLDSQPGRFYAAPVGGHRRGIIRWPELHESEAPAFVRLTPGRWTCPMPLPAAVVVHSDCGIRATRCNCQPEMHSTRNPARSWRGGSLVRPVEALDKSRGTATRDTFVDALVETAVQSRRNHSGLRTVPWPSRRPLPRPARPSMARAPLPSARRANTASG
jgi:hypothetical protein